MKSDERTDRVNAALVLTQKTKSMVFGTDAYLLAAFCHAQKSARAVDLGCGAGAVALLLAARGAAAHVYGVEAQEPLAELARKNAAENGFSDTVSVLFRDVRTLTPADLGGKVQLAVANPPYMKADAGAVSPYAARQASRHEVMGGIADFAAAAARCLVYGGRFYTVYRPDRLSSLFAALSANGFAPKRMLFVHGDPQKPPAMVLTEARLGAAEGLSLLPPLFLHASAGEKAMTPRAAEIYEKGCF